MPEHMILDGKVVDARYRLRSDAAVDESLKEEDAIPFDQWLARKTAGETLNGVGAILEGDLDIRPLRDEILSLPFVVLNLPKFADGRVYSHARRIRSVWGYEGVILIVGDVLRDQLLYMSRCGVNAFYMRADQDLVASLAAFELYSEHYQYNASAG